MMTFIWLLLGVVLGIGFLLFAQRQGQEEKRLLAMGLVLAALVYVAFLGIFGGTTTWFWIELGGVLVYSFVAWLGWRFHTLWLAVGWGLHPIWDAALHLFVGGADFVPEWYVWACISFDIVVAAYIVMQVRQRKLVAT
ncbi:MAG: DUF6010 family protein [Chloroflexota bacterium]